MSNPLATPDALGRFPQAPGFPDTGRLQALAEVFLCSSIPTQLGLGLLLRLLGWQAADAQGRLSFSFVLTLSLADTALLIALMVTFMRMHGETPRLVWRGTRPLGREILVGVATVVPLIIGVGIMLNTIRLFAPWLHNVKANPLEGMAGTPGQALLFGVVAIVAGGVREELQRAFLLRRFESSLGGARVGLVVLSVAFGLGHYVQGWDAAITTGVLGAIWAVMYLRRRSSAAPLVSHALFNSLEVVRAGFGA